MAHIIENAAIHLTTTVQRMHIRWTVASHTDCVMLFIIIFIQIHTSFMYFYAHTNLDLLCSEVFSPRPFKFSLLRCKCKCWRFLLHSCIASSYTWDLQSTTKRFFSCFVVLFSGSDFIEREETNVRADKRQKWSYGELSILFIFF